MDLTLLELLKNYKETNDVSQLSFALVHIAKSLYDVDTISRQLAGKGASGCHFLLKITSQILDEYKFNHHHPTEGKEINSREAFIYWLLAQMLRLLSHPGCTELQDKCISLLVQFLKSMKLNEPYLFKRSIEKLIYCSGQLIMISENLQSNVDPFGVTSSLEIFNTNMELVCQCLPESQRKTEIMPATIEIGMDACEMLQLNITEIILQIMHYMPGDWAVPSVAILWGSLTTQVENCDIPLKVVSMKVIANLLSSYGLPGPDLLEYFVAVFVAIPTMLYSDNTDVSDGERDMLENASHMLIQTVVDADSRSFGTHFDCNKLELILMKFSTAINLPGWTRNLRQEEPKAIIGSVSQLLSHVLMKLNKITNVFGPIHRPLILALQETLCFMVSMTSNSQFLVQNLSTLILWELQEFLNNCPDNSEEMQRKLKKSYMQSKKRKIYLKGKPILQEDKSQLFKKMKQKLQDTLQFLNSLESCEESEKILWSLTGIQVIIEMSVLLFYSWEDMIEKEKAGQEYKTSNITSLKFIEWITEKELTEISSTWRQFLVISSFAPDSESKRSLFNQGMKIIARSVAALQILTSSTDLIPECQMGFAAILSLPWLPGESSWGDLHVSNAKGYAEVANKLHSFVDVSTSCLLVRVLSFIPKEICSQWRCRVFTLVLSEYNESELTSEAVSSLPILLNQVGNNYNYLVNDYVIPLLKINKPDIHDCLAKTFGMFACVMARQTALARITLSCLNHSEKENILSSFRLNCSKCENATNHDAGTTFSVKLTLCENPKLFGPFFQLLEQQNASTQKLFCLSLKRVFCHIELRITEEWGSSMLNSAFCLVNNPDRHITILFSDCLKNLIENSGNSIAEIVFNKLQEALKDSKLKKTVRLQSSIIMTLGILGRSLEGDLLLNVVLILLENTLSDIPLISAVAYTQLQNLSKIRKTGPKPFNIFLNYRQPICKFLVSIMHDVPLQGSGKKPEQMLREVSNVFEHADIRAFLHSTERFLLPQLVAMATPKASTLIKLLANYLQVPSRMKLLISCTKYVFSYLMRHHSRREIEKALQFHLAETEIELSNLLRIDFQRVHNELLLHLSASYTKVFNGLKLLSTYDEHYKGNIESTEDMADYLQPRLLGVLAFFDSQLLISSIPVEEKKLTLKSLTSIIQLMGPKHVTFVRYKIMNTLRIGLRFKENGFPEISCCAWNAFVRHVELPALGDMLSPISATLLPLIQQLPAQSAEIFQFLFVENKEALCSYFHEIYYLPDIPELSNVQFWLKQYASDLSSQSDLKTKISHSLRGVAHESLDVQIHALSKLKNLLHTSHLQLHQYMLDSENADAIVSQLISVLLSVCRVPDQKIRCLAGECLGEVGAIDPGRLELMSNNPKEEMAKFQASTEDDNFVFGLINEIIRAFLASTETRVQDCASLALQDLLQIYNISDKGDEKEGQGSKLWKRFPEHVQEILQPLLSSKYVSSSVCTWENLQKPIYGSAKGLKYKDWISTWTAYLSSRVTQDRPFKVFQACSPIARHDTSIALYVLPHIILQVLLDGAEPDLQDLHNEIMEVLNQVRKSDTRQGSVADFRHMSAQTIFSVLDYLTKWRTNRAQVKASEMPSSKEPVYLKDKGYNTINIFLKQIPQDMLAEACFNCDAYTRALMHFEQFIRNKDRNIQDHLDFLQRLYVAMDEPDGVAGVAAIRQAQPTLVQQILAHQSVGQYQDAEACYERAVQLEPNEISHHHGWLRSLIELGQLNKALMHADGVLANKPAWTSQLNSYRVEAASKLGDWDKLESHVKLEKDNRNWAVGLGKILLAIRDGKEDMVKRHLNNVRSELMGPLSAATMESGSYLRGYEYIVRLHMLNEIEQVQKVLFNFSTNAEKMDCGGESDKMNVEDLLNQWDSRLKFMQPSFRIQEPILTFRRTLLTLIPNNDQLKEQIGKWLLSTAMVAREAGYLQTAYGSLIQAASYNLPEFCLEKAKWFWGKGQNDQALSCLQKGMAEHFPEQLKKQNTKAAKEKLFTYAQAQLLYARYCDETSSMDSNTILRLYKEVTTICREWEDGYFSLAKYYDKMKNSILDDGDNTLKQGEFIIYVVKYYSVSLQYGNQYIYQSLPRLLSLWLDYGSTVVQSAQRLPPQRPILQSLNSVIDQLSRKLAPYQLFTAFPQLISRICHANSDVFMQLVKIIAKLLYSFPAQAMWMLMAVSKSSYPKRVQRCQEIFEQAKLMNEELGKFLMDATKLTERLLELSERHCTNIQPLSLSQHFKPLKRLLDDSNFSRIIVPLQSSMTVTLPMTSTGNKADHNPFPSGPVYISTFEDTIEILPSLQKPKKITIRGSDGHLYVMMCKPKDDLRKDCRLMEFNTIVNKFLRKDPEARKRQLLIRTYTVIPLNEECGIIEWVNNTSGLQHILRKLYREKGLQISNRELRSYIPSLQAPIERKLELFRQLLLLHPCVFHEWFLRTFPDPTAWYNARLAYARTSAVMNMVGYMLGLGDRHGENILMDSTTGDCVHVDFNCLFNKGETFEWPERVPFRFTNNMIGAMGPMGYEGIFRQACEVTLRVLRNQMDPLMSILKPFIYDPLVEWQKTNKMQRSHQVNSGEITNEQALTHVQMIEHRMRGILASKTKPRGLPLSVEGQVNNLIQEATSETLLCQMYIGWAAYL